ncbi:MAG: hypothetical protein K0R38_407 [Polyangiaceae bacterium]|nr:hypothetical protein [Polyangiaceae bacterium]
MLVVMGIALGLVSLGCSSSDAESSDGPDRSEGGGMDGGGQIGVGLAWDKDVFLQPLWQDGEMTMNVVNRRAQAVEVEIAPFVCEERDTGLADDCEVVLTQALVNWPVPADSTASFAGAPLLEHDGLLSVRLGDEQLGLMEAPHPPLGADPGAFVSNQGFGTSSRRGRVELTTSYASVPGETFQAQLTVTQGGRLFIAPEPAQAGVVVVTPQAARSDAPPVDASGVDFVVDVPPSASETSPFRLELEFALPNDAPAGSVFVIQPGRLCTEFTEGSTSLTLENCAGSTGTLRLLLPSP